MVLLEMQVDNRNANLKFLLLTVAPPFAALGALGVGVGIGSNQNWLVFTGGVCLLIYFAIAIGVVVSKTITDLSAK